MVANRTILKFGALPIAHFEADVLYFSNHILKILKFWVPAASEVRWSRTVSKNKPYFRVFFINVFFYPYWPNETQSVIHGWKATDLLFLVVRRKNHPVKRPIFGDASGQTSALIMTLCVIAQVSSHLLDFLGAGGEGERSFHQKSIIILFSTSVTIIKIIITWGRA